MTSKKLLQDDKPAAVQPAAAHGSWFTRISWAITICLVVLMVAFVSSRHLAARAAAIDSQAATPISSGTVNIPYTSSKTPPVALPAFDPLAVLDSISPLADSHTIAPTQPRETALDYTVASGDSIFAIAKDFNVKPDSILWANNSTLKDNPDIRQALDTELRKLLGLIKPDAAPAAAEASVAAATAGPAKPAPARR